MDNQQTADLQDELVTEAARLIVATQSASISMIQRRMRIGYMRAATIMDTLEKRGVVGPFNGTKPREIFPPVQSVQSPDTDPREKDAIRCGERPFERNAERRAVDRIL